MDQTKWFENQGTPPNLPKVDVALNGDEPSFPGIPCVRYGVNPADWDWSKSLADGSSIRRWRVAADIWTQVGEVKVAFGSKLEFDND